MCRMFVWLAPTRPWVQRPGPQKDVFVVVVVVVVVRYPFDPFNAMSFKNTRRNKTELLASKMVRIA